MKIKALVQDSSELIERVHVYIERSFPDSSPQLEKNLSAVQETPV